MIKPKHSTEPGTGHHLAIGKDQVGTRVLALIDDTTVAITRLDTGEIIAINHIDPNRDYCRDTIRPAGRWPK